MITFLIIIFVPMNLRIVAAVGLLFLLGRKLLAKANASYTLSFSPAGLPQNLRVSGTSLTMTQRITITNPNLREALKFDSVIGNVFLGNRQLGTFTTSGGIIPMNGSIEINPTINLNLAGLGLSIFSLISNDAALNINYSVKVGAGIIIPGTSSLTIPNFKALFQSILSKTNTKTTTGGNSPDMSVIPSAVPTVNEFSTEEQISCTV